ncbi:circadian locomoter output cycles protein kaput-like [Bufo gargarizans]|uniref:circadian locomoter output cycles protein kaput-like n=1 Tax=Bufo gargarizans TaxID=30331 RepID=UPI001CF2B5DE|nr:circadian locomoter output cycles protein kaput-like [Bufo gargarizans]XP_044140452.1 circadian locomoter output cycles protein kaput-like [Bufo gargarizans]
METLQVSDIISTCSKFIKEGIQEYAEKENISSIPADRWSLLTLHVVMYCLEKTAAQLLKNPESIIREDKTQTIVEEERHVEVETYIEHILQSSADPSKINVDVNPLIKLMTEHHKQQQESQEKANRTLQDQLSHQHRQQEQRQQQQNNVFKQFLQQQQDFQSRLMADFIKHIEMQATLFCQALANGKTEQPVQDDHVNMNREDTSCYKPSSPETTSHSNTGHHCVSGQGSAEKPGSFSHYEDTSCYKPSSPETTYHSNTGHHCVSGQGSAQKSGSFSHYEVTNRGKQPFPVFDCHELGQQFCQWFYSHLNAQNPSPGQEKPHWDPNILWKDVIFSIVHDNSFDKYTGDECVSSKLLEMTQYQKLTFTPIPDSKRLSCVNSKHGLVVVAVTGVITNSDNCSRVFNQIFGLIRCPSTGNYKIKSIYLRIDNWDPLISGHKLHVPPLQYTTEQLQEYKIDHIGSM